MSLISDALKKARQEAARQDSLRQGVPYAMGVAEPAGRRAPWISLLAGLGAGCILAAVVFALAFFAGWGPFHKPAAEARIAVAPATSRRRSQPPPAPCRPRRFRSRRPPRRLRRSWQRPRRPRRHPRRRPAKPEPPLRTERPAAEGRASPRRRRSRLPWRTSPAPVPASADPSGRPVPRRLRRLPRQIPAAWRTARSTPGRCLFPGGGSVKLNGIAFSQDHPSRCSTDG